MPCPFFMFSSPADFHRPAVAQGHHGQKQQQVGRQQADADVIGDQAEQGRHQAVAGPSLNDEEAAIDAVDTAPSPQTLAERTELKEQIEAGLAALPPDYRQVLILREMHQRSYQEISDILSLDLGTVKSRINRGRKQLRKFLLESGNFSAAPPSKEAEKEG